MMQTATHHQPKVSIIMAAHNAAKTIKAAIESVIRQTFSDFELIIIDDGSTDATGDIAGSFAAKDKRIHVIRQQNHGVGASRALGIREASGKYSIHIDSDDWIEPDMLAEMTETAERHHADITICDFITDVQGHKQVYCPQFHEDTRHTTLIPALLLGKLHGSLCNKLIRHSIYQDLNINVNSGLQFGEDMVTVLRMLQNSPKIIFLPKAFYHYCLQKGSLTSSFSIKGFEARKAWASAIYNLLGSQYSEEQEILKYRVKMFAMYAGVIRRKEFYSYSHTPLKYIRYLAGNRRMLPAVFAATARCFYTAKFLCCMFR